MTNRQFSPKTAIFQNASKHVHGPLHCNTHAHPHAREDTAAAMVTSMDVLGPNDIAKTSISIELVDLDHGHNLPIRIRLMLKIARRRFDLRCQAVDWNAPSPARPVESTPTVCNCGLCNPSMPAEVAK